MARIGINGFGRVGRQVLRALIERHPAHEVVALNDLTDVRTNAHLLAHDSTYGKFSGTIETRDGSLVVNGRRIKVLSERDPANLPWTVQGVDLVVESTGHFTDAEKAAAHLQGGAKRVVISAPATGEDITVNMGVNHTSYDPAKHRIVSNGIMHDQLPLRHGDGAEPMFGIRSGFINTYPLLHQRPGDPGRGAQRPPPRPRRRPEDHPDDDGGGQGDLPRAAGAQGQDERAGLRVPTPTVSVVDLTVALEKSATAETSTRPTAAPRRRSRGGIWATARSPSSLDGLQRRPAQRDSRRAVDHGDRRHGQGALLVRQRVGILVPIGRSCELHGRTWSVMASRVPAAATSPRAGWPACSTCQPCGPACRRA